ncbi:MAG: alpha/beta hydrolase [Clostridiaceae bacterium]
MIYNKDEQERLVSLIEKRQEEKNIHNLDMIIKNIPDNDNQGDLDPRVKDSLEKAAASFANAPKVEPPKSADDIPVDIIRSMMGCENFDISNGIETMDKIIEGRNGDIPLKIYTSNKSEKMPAIVFIHGGGFLGGSTKTVDNACRYLAEKIEGVVVSVDYRLCPEHRFPQGLHDCFYTIKWLYENAKELKVNKDAIGVSGDSAGGNLSAVCSLMDRDLKTNMIKFQGLIYPTVMMSKKEVDDYKFDINLYNIKHNNELVKTAIMMLTNFPPVSLLYLNNDEEMDNPYVSPLLADSLSGVAETLIVTAEYDYLTLEAEAYGRKLIRDGVKTKIIRYNGVDHAFIDKIGIYPQAQDCINEVAKAFINAVQSK